MIPYLQVEPLPLGPLRIEPSAALVATAIVVAHLLLIRQAGRQGLDTRTASIFSAIMLLGGLVGGHIFKYLYMEGWWDFLKTNPTALLTIFTGQSSFGGLGGGLICGLAYLRLKGLRGDDTLRMMDCLAQVFPYAWFFARMQCVLVHDHPGIRTTSWLGVRYPDATRFDLAVIEVLFILALIAVWRLLDRWKWQPGFYLGFFLFSYGIFRFFLDALHVDVVRYFGLSVDRWASLTFVAAGGLLLYRIRWWRLSLWRLASNPAEVVR